jgi:hypothetical protein
MSVRKKFAGLMVLLVVLAAAALAATTAVGHAEGGDPRG